mmetsp:Transcript_115970/g.322981  ORF Transcript_115970/g.322981 Transcript_115970/m.322981 type:complete len:231 (+) Transcript_115970:317-1009(+)
MAVPRQAAVDGLAEFDVPLLEADVVHQAQGEQASVAAKRLGHGGNELGPLVSRPREGGLDLGREAAQRAVLHERPGERQRGAGPEVRRLQGELLDGPVLAERLQERVENALLRIGKLHVQLRVLKCARVPLLVAQQRVPLPFSRQASVQHVLHVKLLLRPSSTLRDGARLRSALQGSLPRPFPLPVPLCHDLVAPWQDIEECPLRQAATSAQKYPPAGAMAHAQLVIHTV